MKIVVKTPRTLDTDVEIPVAGGEPQQIRCTWRVLGSNARAEFLERAATSKQTGVASLLEVLQAWQGPKDEDGAPLPLTRAHLAALLDQYPGADLALVNAYVAACDEAYRKN